MTFFVRCEQHFLNYSSDFTAAGNDILIGVGIFNCILAVPTSVLNAFVVFAILSTGCFQSPSYLFITSLAFSDFIVGIICQPLLAALLFTFSNNQFLSSCYIMGVYYIIISWSSWASFFTITAISFDRYLAIRLKTKYKIIITCFRVKCTLAFIWIFSFFAMTLLLLVKGDIGLYSILGSISNSLCFAVTILCYSLSYKTLNSYCEQIQSNSQQSVGNGIDVIKYRKLLKTMLMIVMTIFLCYFPLLICFIVMIVPGNYDSENFRLSMSKWGLHTLTAMVTVMTLNSFFNPIIYITRMKDLRQACIQTLRKLYIRTSCNKDFTEANNITNNNNSTNINSVQPVANSDL